MNHISTEIAPWWPQILRTIAARYWAAANSDRDEPTEPVFLPLTTHKDGDGNEAKIDRWLGRDKANKEFEVVCGKKVSPKSHTPTVSKHLHLIRKRWSSPTRQVVDGSRQ